jgi:hypothetical protein
MVEFNVGKVNVGLFFDFLNPPYVLSRCHPAGAQRLQGRTEQTISTDRPRSNPSSTKMISSLLCTPADKYLYMISTAGRRARMQTWLRASRSTLLAFRIRQILVKCDYAEYQYVVRSGRLSSAHCGIHTLFDDSSVMVTVMHSYGCSRPPLYPTPPCQYCA